MTTPHDDLHENPAVCETGELVECAASHAVHVREHDDPHPTNLLSNTCRAAVRVPCQTQKVGGKDRFAAHPHSIQGGGEIQNKHTHTHIQMQ